MIKELCGYRQISSALKAVMVTTNRNKAIKKGLMFVTLDQYNKCFARLDVHSGDAVIYAMSREIEDCMSEKLESQKFDKLSGLTFAINEYHY